jgi:hypothetical protein
LEYNKEVFKKTDRENDIGQRIGAIGRELKQLAQKIKDNGELLRKFELEYNSN